MSDEVQDIDWEDTRQAIRDIANAIMTKARTGGKCMTDGDIAEEIAKVLTREIREDTLPFPKN